MRIGAILAAALLACACSKTESPRPDGVALRTLDAGAHRVEVRMPADWDVARRDAALRLHAPFADGADPSEVLLVDLGAATPKGMREELSVARELWRTGDIDAAKLHVRGVPVGSPLVPSLGAPSAYASAWSRLLHPPGNMTPDEADGHFATLLSGLSSAPPPSLETVVDWAVPVFDGTRLTSISHTSGGRYEGQQIDRLAGQHSARRRDIVATTARTVNGRPAIEVETRDNLTHTGRRLMTFVVHAERLLVIASAPATGQSFDVYEGVRDSLVFRD
jgi:hypothetical protein